MTRHVYPGWWPLRQLTNGPLRRCTPAVLDLPPPGEYGLPHVGVRSATVRAPGPCVADRATERHMAAGPTHQVTVLGTRPAGRCDREGAV
ncbi:hypothetical protein [Streptomyces albicerus]|uniref:hypothetical protein n=1 Tax=Streptomyces albicerus TaxID=2569859 RepID=UPI001788E183|nr:hypothetical protein [Streptomyces albicerus]